MVIKIKTLISFVTIFSLNQLMIYNVYVVTEIKILIFFVFIFEFKRLCNIFGFRIFEKYIQNNDVAFNYLISTQQHFLNYLDFKTKDI